MEENKTAKRIGIVIKITLSVALFVFIGALIFRMCQASYKALEELERSSAFEASYERCDDVRTHAVNDEFSENGAVYAYSLVYIEKEGYIQFSVRYNKRHIDEVKLSYPEFDENSIRYELVSEDGRIYTPTILKTEDKFNYRYFKMEFTDVDFSTKSLSVKMILDGIDINVGNKSTLVIHRKDDTYIPYEFNK